jgi:hypothetical protein
MNSFLLHDSVVFTFYFHRFQKHSHGVYFFIIGDLRLVTERHSGHGIYCDDRDSSKLYTPLVTRKVMYIAR